MTQRKVSEIMYKLDCGDIVFAPGYLVNGALRCPKCEERRSIAGVIVYEWHARCRDCKFSQWAGMSKENASHFCTMHVIRNSGHRTYYEYAENPRAKKTLQKFKAYHGAST
jgi:hypothetical protein